MDSHDITKFKPCLNQSTCFMVRSCDSSTSPATYRSTICLGTWHSSEYIFKTTCSRCQVEILAIPARLRVKLIETLVIVVVLVVIVRSVDTPFLLTTFVTHNVQSCGDNNGNLLLLPSAFFLFFVDEASFGPMSVPLPAHPAKMVMQWPPLWKWPLPVENRNGRFFKNTYYAQDKSQREENLSWWDIFFFDKLPQVSRSVSNSAATILLIMKNFGAGG